MRFLFLLAMTLIPAALASPTLPDIDSPLRTGNRVESDTAVIVGNETYAFIGDVPYAARDARAFYRLAVYGLGVPRDNVQLLDKGASREMIAAAVEKAAKKAGRSGRVWFYFAGHGAASPSTGERILLGDDVRAQLESFEPRSLAVSEVEKIAGSSGADLVMLLDTCWTGQGRSGADLLDGKRFAMPTYAFEEAGKNVEWVATGPNQWSAPFHDVEHGAFTYFAIGALRGWADGQMDGKKDGIITAEEAQLFVEQSLQDHGFADQTPEIRVTKGHQFNLAEIGDAAEPNPFENVSAVVVRTPTQETVVETSEVGFKLEVAPGDSRLASEIESRIDRDTDPCSDFYQFSCGDWLEEAKLPEGKEQWSLSFNEIRKRTHDSMIEIMTGIVPGASDAMLDFYETCKDVDAVERLGSRPVKAAFDDIDRLSSVEDLMRFLPASPSEPLFATYVDRDPDTGMQALLLMPGGLSAGHEAYYDSADHLSSHETYLRELFNAAGDRDPKRSAADTMAIEKRLRKHYTSSRGWAAPVSHTRAELKALMPGLEVLLNALDYPADTAVLVYEKAWFSEVDNLIRERGIAGLRPYLKAHLLVSTAAWLSTDFTDLSARWDVDRDTLCLNLAAEYFPDEVGKAYVGRHFVGRSQERVDEISAGMVDATGRRLQSLSWMDATSLKTAQQKHRSLNLLIGKPDHWEPSGTIVHKGDLYGSLAAAYRHQSKRWISRVGKPGDAIWRMSAPTVNAYYNPATNGLVFPAGILQAPLFDERRSRALNYGAIGSIMGHELSHAFDSHGAHYGPTGKESRWWSDSTQTAYDKLTTQLTAQYSAYEAIPGQKVDGSLTLGENVADQAGVRLALDAYRAWAGANQPEPDLAGLSADQQFFVGWAQSWCALQTPERAGVQATTDPHAPAKWRVNGVLANIDDFGRAFECAQGSEMRPRNQVEIW